MIAPVIHALDLARLFDAPVIDGLSSAGHASKRDADRKHQLKVAPSDVNKSVADFVVGNLTTKNRQANIRTSHTQLLQKPPSRVASFSINWIRFKEHFSFNTRHLAASEHSRLAAKSLSTERSPSSSGVRSALEARAPAFSTPIKDTSAPIMERHVIHNALEHRALRDENRHG